jgi:hypothetical protein
MLMLDVFYLLVGLGFFGLTAAYIRACERLSRDVSHE